MRIVWLLVAAVAVAGAFLLGVASQGVDTVDGTAQCCVPTTRPAT